MTSRIHWTLLLNATFEPLMVISWKKAVVMVFLDKVEVVEEYERILRGVTFALRLPAVIRLTRYVRRKTPLVKLSRQNLYVRDSGRCQYCGVSFEQKELTYDHVIPKSRGGKTRWENIVTCCVECNRKKGGRTPGEASMKLVRAPGRPTWVPAIRITIGFHKVPETWRDYLYWNVELVE